MSLWTQYAENQNRRIPTASEQDAKAESDAAKAEDDRRFWSVRDGKTETYKQICDKPKDREYADLCQQWRVAETAELQLVAGVFGIAGLLATIVYTHRTFRLSARTAERELRAYLGVKVDSVTVRPGRRAEMKLDVVNAGQTPAHNVRTTYYGAIHPVDAPPSDFQISPSREPMPTLVIHPSSDIHVYPRAARPLTKKEYLIIQGDEFAFFVWGRVDYTDAFGKPRLTNFRFRFGGPLCFDTDRAAFTREGNDAT